MQLKEFNLMLDVKNSHKVEEFEVVQGDSNSNILNISLRNGLEPFNLIGTNVEISFKKSDGTTVLQSEIAVINDLEGKISCTLKTNTIASPGKVLAEVRILEIDTLLTSTRFNFYVRPSIINDETIESTNEFPILTQLINEIKEITEQVPEEVVTNLNNLQTYVNGLAGVGRTNETVKKNADNINQVTDDLDAHKAESMSYAALITRDISLDGVQKVILPFKAKAILQISTIPNTKSYSIGTWSENNFQSCVYLVDRATSDMSSTGRLLRIGIDATNFMTGAISSVADDYIEITWTKTGSPTGAVNITLQATAHGRMIV